MDKIVMVNRTYKLTAADQVSLNTEIRYIVASSRVDDVKLITLIPLITEDEKENKRSVSSAIKILGSLKREGAIKFYIKRESLYDSSVESEFILNKYFNYLESGLHETNSIFVKL